jgi:hypothetical protein
VHISHTYAQINSNGLAQNVLFFISTMEPMWYTNLLTITCLYLFWAGMEWNQFHPLQSWCSQQT